MAKNDLLGSIFLVSGTTIGAGMIALPVAAGIYGYGAALFMFISVWFACLVIAFSMLEANLQHKSGANLITMIRHTLGLPGEVIGWVSCLLLLYCLIAAYLSGLGELIRYSLNYFFEVDIQTTTSVLLVTAIFSLLIFLGIRASEHVNRALVLVILLVFLSLVFITVPYVDSTGIQVTDFESPALSLPVIFTSFGYLVIIPSLRTYLSDDVRSLKIACTVGSLIPLLLYVLWTTVVMGVIPVEGANGLGSIRESGDPATGILRALAEVTNNSQVGFIFRLFFFLAIASSLIGVSLGTFDFLADGLRKNNSQYNQLILTALTFAPPLIIVLAFEQAFLCALGYAAIFSAIIFGIMPAVMPWIGRRKGADSHYKLPGGSATFSLIVMFSVTVIIIELINNNV